MFAAFLAGFKKSQTSVEETKLVVPSVTAVEDSLKLSVLQEVLECPVCYSVPRESPIYQCTNGHLICKDCYGKLTVCHSCRQPQAENRNLVTFYKHILNLFTNTLCTFRIKIKFLTDLE